MFKPHNEFAKIVVQEDYNSMKCEIYRKDNINIDNKQ